MIQESVIHARKGLYLVDSEPVGQCDERIIAQAVVCPISSRVTQY